jgi:hypothetical protein
MGILAIKYIENLERMEMKHESEGEVNVDDIGNERDRSMKRTKQT